MQNKLKLRKNSFLSANRLELAFSVAISYKNQKSISFLKCLRGDLSDLENFPLKEMKGKQNTVGQGSYYICNGKSIWHCQASLLASPLLNIMAISTSQVPETYSVQCFLFQNITTTKRHQLKLCKHKCLLDSQLLRQLLLLMTKQCFQLGK